MRSLFTQSRRTIASFAMRSEALGGKCRAPTIDMPNAPDPNAKNTSAAVECLRLVEKTTVAGTKRE